MALTAEQHLLVAKRSRVDGDQNHSVAITLHKTITTLNVGSPIRRILLALVFYWRLIVVFNPRQILHTTGCALKKMEEINQMNPVEKVDNLLVMDQSIIESDTRNKRPSG